MDNIIAFKITYCSSTHERRRVFILLRERKSVCSTSHTKMKLGFIRFRKIDGFNFVLIEKGFFGLRDILRKNLPAKGERGLNI